MKVGDILNGVLTLRDKAEAVRERINRSENERNVEVSPRNSTRDSVSLRIKEILKEAQSGVENYPEVREDRVRELQARIREGTYQVSNKDLARAMLRALLADIS